MRNSERRDAFPELKDLYRQGSLAQALLISVEPERQLMLRDFLGRLWLCEATQEADCTCRSCQTPLHSHPDWIELNPTSKIIRIEEVRMAVSTMQVAPTWSPSKVIALYPADTLGREAANYLLKHLEEPPRFAQYLLVTNAPDGILPTVKSRLQYWRLVGDRKNLAAENRSNLLEILRHEKLTSKILVQACYWVRDQYYTTHETEWLSVWEAIMEASFQLDSNGNEDLVRARILRSWPTTRSAR